jgi:hypothetical protein
MGYGYQIDTSGSEQGPRSYEHSDDFKFNVRQGNVFIS